MRYQQCCYLVGSLLTGSVLTSSVFISNVTGFFVPPHCFGMPSRKASSPDLVVSFVKCNQILQCLKECVIDEHNIPVLKTYLHLTLSEYA